MIRSIMFCFIFVIVFLMGVIVGSDREQITEQPQMQYESIEKQIHKQDELPTNEVVHIDYSHPDEAHVMHEEIPDRFTHKLAAILATGFHHLYELIIDFLYEVANLFF